MPYINTLEQTFGHSYNDLIMLFPNASVTLGLNFEQYQWYDDTTPPDFEDNQYLQEQFPEIVDNKLSQVWKVITIPEEEYSVKLQAIKNEQKEKINNWRLLANKSYFVHLGKKIACDDLSWRDLTGTNDEITNLGRLPDLWPGGWKTMDNSYIPITTIEDWKAFYSAMYATGVNNFIKAQQLKAAVDSATNIKTILEIVW